MDRLFQELAPLRGICHVIDGRHDIPLALLVAELPLTQACFEHHTLNGTRMTSVLWLT